MPIETINPADSPSTYFTYFDIGSIDGRTNRIVEPKTVLGRNAPSRARQSVRKNDILFSTVRTYLKKIARVEHGYPNPIASTGFVVVRAARGISPQFLFFQLLSDEFVERINLLQTGTSYPAVRSKDILGEPILIPPTREQDEIASILDKSFSRVTQGESATRRAIERLERYRTAVLHAAVAGDLTLDWRRGRKASESGVQLLKRVLRNRRVFWENEEEGRMRKDNKRPEAAWKSRYREPHVVDKQTLPSVPKGWTWASLEQLTSAERPITYGILMPKEHVPSGVPYVKVRDMKNEQLNVSELERTSAKIAARYPRSKLREGDLLLAIRGTYGRVAVVPADLDGGNITQDTARLAVIDGIDPGYILWALRSDRAQTYLNKVARGIAVKGVNIGDVRKTPIPLPPRIEQKEIVRRLERLLGAADRLMHILQRQLQLAQRTRQTLLRDAFTGKLATYDPEDESAAVLIQHIRAVREAEAKKPRGKRMRKPRSINTRRSLLDVLHEHREPMTPEQLFTEAGYETSEADLFYRELASLRDIISEQKPTTRKARAWPFGAKVLLHLKEK